MKWILIERLLSLLLSIVLKIPKPTLNWHKDITVWGKVWTTSPNQLRCINFRGGINEVFLTRVWLHMYVCMIYSLMNIFWKNNLNIFRHIGIMSTLPMIPVRSSTIFLLRLCILVYKNNCDLTNPRRSSLMPILEITPENYLTQ